MSSQSQYGDGSPGGLLELLPFRLCGVPEEAGSNTSEGMPQPQPEGPTRQQGRGQAGRQHSHKPSPALRTLSGKVLGLFPWLSKCLTLKLDQSTWHVNISYYLSLYNNSSIRAGTLLS